MKYNFKNLICISQTIVFISWPASKDVNELIFSYKICIATNLKFDWLHKDICANKVHNSDLSVDFTGS
jgi:hypothetical protein